jgi:hypothetical protein
MNGEMGISSGVQPAREDQTRSVYPRYVPVECTGDTVLMQNHMR